MTTSQSTSEKTYAAEKPAERKSLRIPSQSSFLAGQDNVSDYTSNTASNRYLKINLGFIKYGTDDKTQGAAMVLSILLLLIIILTSGACLWWDKLDFATIILQLLFPAFTLVAGVAIGKSLNNDGP